MSSPLVLHTPCPKGNHHQTTAKRSGWQLWLCVGVPVKLRRAAVGPGADTTTKKNVSQQHEGLLQEGQRTRQNTCRSICAQKSTHRTTLYNSECASGCLCRLRRRSLSHIIAEPRRSRSSALLCFAQNVLYVPAPGRFPHHLAGSSLCGSRQTLALHLYQCQFMCEVL